MAETEQQFYSKLYGKEDATPSNPTGSKKKSSSSATVTKESVVVKSEVQQPSSISGVKYNPFTQRVEPVNPYSPKPGAAQQPLNVPSSNAVPYNAGQQNIPKGMTRTKTSYDKYGNKVSYSEQETVDGKNVETTNSALTNIQMRQEQQTKREMDAQLRTQGFKPAGSGTYFAEPGAETKKFQNIVTGYNSLLQARTEKEQGQYLTSKGYKQYDTSLQYNPFTQQVDKRPVGEKVWVKEVEKQKSIMDVSLIPTTSGGKFGLVSPSMFGKSKTTPLTGLDIAGSKLPSIYSLEQQHPLLEKGLFALERGGDILVSTVYNPFGTKAQKEVTLKNVPSVKYGLEYVYEEGVRKPSNVLKLGSAGYIFASLYAAALTTKVGASVLTSSASKIGLNSLTAFYGGTKVGEYILAPNRKAKSEVFAQTAIEVGSFMGGAKVASSVRTAELLSSLRSENVVKLGGSTKFPIQYTDRTFTIQTGKEAYSVVNMGGSQKAYIKTDLGTGISKGRVMTGDILVGSFEKSNLFKPLNVKLSKPVFDRNIVLNYPSDTGMSHIAWTEKLSQKGIIDYSVTGKFKVAKYSGNINVDNYYYNWARATPQFVDTKVYAPKSLSKLGLYDVDLIVKNPSGLVTSVKSVGVESFSPKFVFDKIPMPKDELVTSYNVGTAEQTVTKVIAPKLFQYSRNVFGSLSGSVVRTSAWRGWGKSGSLLLRSGEQITDLTSVPLSPAKASYNFRLNVFNWGNASLYSPKIKVAGLLGVGSLSRLGLRVTPSSVIKLSPVSIVAQPQTRLPISIQTPIQTPVTIQVPVSISTTRQTQVQVPILTEVPIVSPLPGFVPFIIPKTPFVKTPPLLFGGGGDYNFGQDYGKRLFSKQRKYKYTPTVAAAYLGVRGKKPSYLMISAGALRPILSKGLNRKKSKALFKMPKIGKLKMKRGKKK